MKYQVFNKIIHEETNEELGSFSVKVAGGMHEKQQTLQLTRSLLSPLCCARFTIHKGKKKEKTGKEKKVKKKRKKTNFVDRSRKKESRVAFSRDTFPLPATPPLPSPPLPPQFGEGLVRVTSD